MITRDGTAGVVSIYQGGTDLTGQANNHLASTPEISLESKNLLDLNGRLNPPPKQDISEAEFHLLLLDRTATEFTFQTFDDDKNRKDQSLIRVLRGTLKQHWEELCYLNNKGAGVFVTINVTAGNRRRKKDVIETRAIWQEDDGEGKPLPCNPHFVIETSPGKFHRLILTRTDQVDEFESIQQRLVLDYGSDKNAADRSRVLRLAGFNHMKDPCQPFLVSVHDFMIAPRWSWDEIKQIFPPVGMTREGNAKTRSTPKTESDATGRLSNPDVDKIQAALNHIDPDVEYNDWVDIGMALHHEFKGSLEGLLIWDKWSAKGRKFQQGECPRKWGTFSNSGDIAIATLFHKAVANGWKGRDRPEEDFASLSSELISPVKEQNQYQIVNAQKFLNTDFPPPNPLYGNTRDALMVRGEGLILAGTGGTGKTTLITDFAVRAAMGEDFLDFKASGPMRILILQAELPMGYYKELLVDQLEGYRSGNPEKVGLVDENLFIAILTAVPNLTVGDTLRRIKAEVERVKADIVICDPFLSFFQLKEENNNTEVRRVLDQFKHIVLAPCNCASLITDHVTKVVAGDNNLPITPRGGEAKRDWCATLLGIRHDKHAKNTKALNLTIQKQRYGPRQDNHFLLHRCDLTRHFVLFNPGETHHKAVATIIDKFGKPISKNDLVQEVSRQMGLSMHAARNTIEKAITTGWIKAEKGKRKSIQHMLGPTYLNQEARS
ncbi:PriCT-2 domain-containing protein [Desulfobulbus alkaliphilus]|uniref:PriCT-2 domain-containing protein n=1 Tax=Desulfobulbus alkaliphilus TaxID=869814 RepID=UPI0019640E4B|nr:PriCT-2 domain-containing protein [Desulfobulbus alkaliphilus]MBM9536178.1 AAA family ATPase [Desulfobulbus alkaliphilus]